MRGHRHVYGSGGASDTWGALPAPEDASGCSPHTIESSTSLATTFRAAPTTGRLPDRPKAAYLNVLACLFALFSAVRIFAYLPTLWMIVAGGDSSQHSLMTWSVFLGSNATMTACLWEQNGHHCDRVVAANAGNTLMCLGIVVAIAWTRL